MRMGLTIIAAPVLWFCALHLRIDFLRLALAFLLRARYDAQKLIYPSGGRIHGPISRTLNRRARAQ